MFFLDVGFRTDFWFLHKVQKNDPSAERAASRPKKSAHGAQRYTVFFFPGKVHHLQIL